ncbi:MAG: hypothetical protein KC766_14100, partial [Myxococcales bacterium]|nr:hypothetical protein [Myxococcales bacterium]
GFVRLWVAPCIGAMPRVGARSSRIWCRAGDPESVRRVSSVELRVAPFAGKEHLPVVEVDAARAESVCASCLA